MNDLNHDFQKQFSSIMNKKSKVLVTFTYFKYAKNTPSFKSKNSESVSIYEFLGDKNLKIVLILSYARVLSKYSRGKNGKYP